MSEVDANVSSRLRKPLTDEELRILIAVDEHRMTLNKNGRYEIDYEERPDRRSRENLRKKGLIVDGYPNGYTITDRGLAELRYGLLKRREERDG